MDIGEEARVFLDGWRTDPLKAKKAFLDFCSLLDEEGISFSFKGRQGISFSLRAKHAAQKERDLFVLIDVIDDDPEERWLSVCFYDDMVTDPEEKGDYVPQGLLGCDARCFNLDEENAALEDYIGHRIREAREAAKAS